MIASWMMYALAISVLLTIAAVATERVLTARGLPTRFVWIAALVLSMAWPLAPVAARLMPEAPRPVRVLPFTIVVDVPTNTPIAVDRSAQIDRVLAGLWMTLSLLFAIRLMRGVSALERSRAEWKRGRVNGVRVKLSDNVGPAVVGLRSMEVVLPEWILSLDEPLASAAGNALEIRNAVEFLTGRHRDPRLLEVTLALSAAALELTGFEGNARHAVHAALSTGKATEHFSKMVALLGGPSDFVERMEAHLEAAPIIRDVFAPGEGVVASIDTRGVGMGVVALGGGRRMPTDTIDHAVGFDRLAGLGMRVDRSTPLARLHARDEASAADAERRLIAAYTLGESAPKHPLIVERIDAMETK